MQLLGLERLERLQYASVQFSSVIQTCPTFCDPMNHSRRVYSVTQSCATLWEPMDYNLPTSLLCSGNYPGKNTGVDCHLLFQGIFPTQGSKPHLLHWQADSLPLHLLSREDSPEEGNGSPLQYSCLGNLMDRGTWQATVPRAAKESDTIQQLNNNMAHSRCFG